jgi:hypothetical protein
MVGPVMRERGDDWRDLSSAGVECEGGFTQTHRF